MSKILMTPRWFSSLTRFLAAFLLMALVLSPLEARALDPRLAAINDWLYVLQPETPASPAEIQATDYDLVVMDYSSDGSAGGEFTAGQIASLKASGKVVLAYMSIGEAEVGRFYWDPAWVDQGPGDPDAPPWLGPFNPDFPDNFKVRFWVPGWKPMIFGTTSGPATSYLDRIIDQGFDGVYLDIIDAFTFWSEEMPEIPRGFARSEMILFVDLLAQHARVARGDTDFLVFPQNGIDIVLDGNDMLDGESAIYLSTIDGVGVEDVFYDETSTVAPAEVAFRMGILSDYLDSFGDQRVVLSVDYVWDEASPLGASNVSRYNDFHGLARAEGYASYAAVTDRDLNEIIAVDATGGFAFAQPVAGGGPLFADGFESNDTSAWSLTIP